MQRHQHLFLPVLFHNLRKYDLHHIMKHAVHKLSHWRCEPVAQTGETYLTMMCRIPKAVNIRFIDSLQFLNCSLDKAVKQLEPACFIQTNTLGPNYTSKPIFPYSFVTGFEVLEVKNTSLPLYEAFQDILRNKNPHNIQEYREANVRY